MPVLQTFVYEISKPLLTSQKTNPIINTPPHFETTALFWYKELDGINKDLKTPTPLTDAVQTFFVTPSRTCTFTLVLMTFLKKVNSNPSSYFLLTIYSKYTFLVYLQTSLVTNLSFWIATYPKPRNSSKTLNAKLYPQVPLLTNFSYL